ncbi:hypothetical protein RZS28_02710 [Methylocapsa polymorpha]|uniref:Uncharacterized protein n=1 Tax=Methylocapsa polymorpha TaxID=3080828 RepID=A0ABZ0HSE0_9HYPH|nr:hypothetical protein RZS28_02710 [Methylocapsa sp. RX1]
MIKKAPLAYMFGSTIIAMCAMTVFQWLHEPELRIKDATIENLRQRNEMLERSNKIEGVTESSASGRHLTETQRICLISNLKDILADFPKVALTSFRDEESTKYMLEFQRLFLRVGIDPILFMAGTAKYEDVGVMIGDINANNRSDKSKKFSSIFEKCGFKVKYVPWIISETLMSSLGIKDVDFDLFIGPSN